jgi:hypothetical protein
VSPTICYERLAEYALLSYEVYLGASKPLAYLNAERVVNLANKQNHNLLGFAQKFSSRPARPTSSMLFCDLGSLHYGGSVVGVMQQPVVQIVVPSVLQPNSNSVEEVQIAVSAPPPSILKIPSAGKKPEEIIKLGGIPTPSGTVAKIQNKLGNLKIDSDSDMTPEDFCRFLKKRILDGS